MCTLIDGQIYYFVSNVNGALNTSSPVYFKPE